MEVKSVPIVKSKMVEVLSQSATTVSVKKKLVPSVRGNRTAYRRIQLAHNSLAVVNSVLDMSRCRMPLMTAAEKLKAMQKPKRLKEVSFLCSDNEVITASSNLLFRYTEELRPFQEEDLPIKLPSIHSETLLRAISWMRQHKLEETDGCCGDAEDGWERDMLEGSGDLCQLMDLIMVALHLGLNVLARHGAEYMVEQMAAKTKSEMGLMLKINKALALDIVEMPIETIVPQA